MASITVYFRVLRAWYAFTMLRIGMMVVATSTLVLGSYTFSPTVLAVPVGTLLIQMGGINSSGQAVGWAQDSSFNDFSFISTTSGYTLIPPPAGWTTGIASAINEFGQVTGAANNGTNIQAFIGTTSGSTAIPYI